MSKLVDLRPQKLDLKLYSGDGVDITLTVLDLNDDPVNLTGVITAQIRTLRADADAIQSFSVNYIDRANGIVVLSLTGVQTAALNANGRKFTGFWDVQWTASGSQPRTFCQGNVECDVDVTR